jgi:hypothetical protein
MMIKSPYIYICDKNLEFICLIDLRRKFAKLNAAIEAVQQFNAIGIRSNYKNPFEAQFLRNGDIWGDKANSGAIKTSDLPIRYSTAELLDLLQTLSTRGKDKSKRKVHQNSLNNLKKHPNWSSALKPTKPKKISDELVDEAIQLKSQGMSWRKIGDRLQLNFQSVRTAINRRNSQSGIGSQQ